MDDRTRDDHPEATRRRRLLQAGASAVALGALSGTGFLTAAAQAPFDWWLVDVRPLVADKSLLDPAFAFANFSKGGMDWATQPDGRIDSIPFNIDPWELYYNKELFDARNVVYPRNFAEIIRSREGGQIPDPHRLNIASPVLSGAGGRLPGRRRLQAP